jgi:hypothetical protein
MKTLDEAKFAGVSHISMVSAIIKSVVYTDKYVRDYNL